MIINKELSKGFLFAQLFIFAVVILLNTALSYGGQPDRKNASQQNLQLGCSDWKPYCYKYNNQLRGPLIDMSQMIMDDAGFDYTIDVFPWNRVYKLGLTQPNFLILGLGRTANREVLFKWIAPLKRPSKIYAYQSIHSNIVLAAEDDLKHYKIAVERGSYTYEYLLQRGHDKEKIIIVSRYEQIYNVVSHGRAQFFLMDSSSFGPEAVRAGFDPDAFKPALMAFTVTEYLATGLSTSDEIVERLKLSYDKLISKKNISLPQ